MANCKFCAKMRRWLGMDDALSCDVLWQSHFEESESWEREHSNESEIWWRDSDNNRALIEEGFARMGTHPAAAFGLLKEAADAGSPWAMESVAAHYHSGTRVTADFDKAAAHYHRAICAGSWMATIGYARLLADHGHINESEALLRDGMKLDFVPAYFWFAWLRHKRAPNRATRRAIRPLLDYAARQGHPGAKNMLGRLMLKGKFGILSIPRGIRLLYQTRPPLLKQSDPAAIDGLRGRAREAAAS